jgi:hypothetical protein
VFAIRVFEKHDVVQTYPLEGSPGW